MNPTNAATAVAPADKTEARQAIVDWMKGCDARQELILIRINDAATPWYADDLALAKAVEARCVMLPKCEAASQVADVLGEMPPGTTILPLIETARGMVALQEIAGAAGVTRLAFGSLDYMADLDIPATGLAMPAARDAIAICAAANSSAGLPAGMSRSAM